MKKNVHLLALVLGLGMSLSALAQKDNVGIGTTKPDQSAILDLNSSTKGLLMPRMSLQQRSAIQAPAKGLIVYQTDFVSGFYFFDGDAWKPFTETKANSVAGIDGDWTLIGNAGTTPGTNFIGTTDNKALVFKTNNTFSGQINPSGRANVALGYNAGLTAFTGVSGNSTVAIGYEALMNGTGNSNTAVGSQALKANTSGYGNIGVGYQALFSNTTGTNNMALGSYALKTNLSGTGNMAIGSNALEHSVGNANTAIGAGAGKNKTGSGNIYIGYTAGGNTTGNSVTENNKLYIHSGAENIANPLIKGEFDNKNLKINLGSTKSTTVGFLAVGNFDASFQMPGANSNPVQANSYRLIVQDGIITEKVKVALKTTADWADYVFEPSYQLMPLDKVEAFVKENKHLPNVPSAEDMSKNGLDVTQTSAKLMEKIEELTLYLIELNKEVKALKVENEKLKVSHNQK